MVLDGVVGSSFKDVGNVSPLGRWVSVQEEEDPFLFTSPLGASLYHRIQVVVPSLSALLSNPSGQVIGYLSPFLGTVDVDQLQQKSIFNIGPRSFDEVWVEDLLPPVQALHISPTVNGLSNLLPVLSLVDLDSFSELLVFNLGPMSLDFGICTQASSVWLLVLRWPTLIQMRVLHLMSDQVLLGLSKWNVAQCLRHVALVRASALVSLSVFLHVSELVDINEVTWVLKFLVLRLSSLDVGQKWWRFVQSQLWCILLVFTDDIISRCSLLSHSQVVNFNLLNLNQYWFIIDFITLIRLLLVFILRFLVFSNNCFFCDPLLASLWTTFLPVGWRKVSLKLLCLLLVTLE